MARTDIDADLADLADLDLLDGRVHAYCRRCLPKGKRRVQPGERFLALCGLLTFVWSGDVGDAAHPPDNACVRCLRFVGGRCPRCGTDL